MLVTFNDITNPTTVRRVDPYDLASVFGPGYVLKAITLEITDEKVTEGRVESVLAWLHDPTYRTRPVWPSLTQLQQDTLAYLVAPSGALK